MRALLLQTTGLCLQQSLPNTTVDVPSEHPRLRVTIWLPTDLGSLTAPMSHMTHHSSDAYSDITMFRQGVSDPLHVIESQ